LALIVGAWCLAIPTLDAQRAGVDRLPSEILNVAPPSARVRGTPGGMTVQSTPCRTASLEGARRRIVDVAVQEWAFFGFPVVDRTDISVTAARRTGPRRRGWLAADEASRVATSIAGYWAVTAEGSWIVDRQNDEWEGPEGLAARWNAPWSAAFISWVMCEAGLGEMSQFHRSIAHREYIDQAIRARDGMDAEAAYVAYDAGEAQIEPGDLLCNARASANYRMLADRRSDVGRFAPTHCDIVVKIDERAGRIFVIGGNVEQSVSLTILPLRRDGEAYAKPVDDSIIDGARTVFAHLKLRADRVEPNALDNSPTVRALSAPTN
jgi:hypothetical protein